jgi:ABC-type phosphate transport system substrate-binding protein
MTRVAAIACAIVCTIVSAPAPATESTLAVIVHPDRRVSMTVKELSDIYLKKRRFWDDGQPIVPLNREAGSTERETFSRRVLGSASAAFVGYWNGQYFQGIFPPATLSSSDAVKRYVAADRNAIGYIWSDEGDDSVQVVLRVH